MAAQTVSLLVVLVVASAFALTPGQSGRTYGIEILVVGLVVAATSFVPTIRGLPAVDRLTWILCRLASAIVVTTPLFGAGVSLTAGAGGGLYWVLAWIVVTLVVSTYDAWVLLTEIRR